MAPHLTPTDENIIARHVFRSPALIMSDSKKELETYWCCSRIFDSLVNKKITRNDQFNQNTLSMYWTAEALYNAYKVTGQKEYLTKGQRVLDELLMFQA